MKGKKSFTQSEIQKLRKLIGQRINADRSSQKSIRAKMRRIGFYGGDDFGISDLQPRDFEQLLESGRVTVIGQSQSISTKVKTEPAPKRGSEKPSRVHNYAELNFVRFDPLLNRASDIPDESGNYIVCLRLGSMLPDVGVDYKTTCFDSLPVIYTGIAGKSLRTRDYKQHFTGNNAGSSTLRKSLGSLFGYKKVPRDKDPSNGKTKFGRTDEEKLSAWMKENLVLFYAVNIEPDSVESDLIGDYDPPLNLSKNKSIVNSEYRKNLSRLRAQK